MRIVVGALWTPRGEAAIDCAFSEARVHPNSEVHLVAYVEAPEDDEPSTNYSNELHRQQESVQRAASELSAEHGIPVSTHVPQGVLRPSDAILRVSREIEADLIVISIRRRSRVGKLLMGSNAQLILLGADCPVLSVNLPEDD